MKTLVINTYGGSLLLGAQAAGAEIVGSYEDAGFGFELQEANFPHLDLRKTRADWPELDLSETFVIAHPPCSAFSNQAAWNNTSGWGGGRGIDSEAFRCTREVLAYAMRHKAVAIAVESVVPAMQGAWEVHQHYADLHGYHLYRVLQNGAMFGAQWRDRFWAIYLRKGAAPEVLPLQLKPDWMTVDDVISGFEDGDAPPGMETHFALQRRYLAERGGLSEEQIDDLFADKTPPRVGNLLDVLQKEIWPSGDKWAIREMVFTGMFMTVLVRYLDPAGLAGTLLSNTSWHCRGRLLSERAYKRLMGFPADYAFPKKQRRDLRMYLSKGVMPPVAEWITRQVFAALGAEAAPEAKRKREWTPYRVEVRPNDVADLRIRKKDWPLGPTGLDDEPKLRHEED
jgi:site-specific DNA-cytosine methylase